MFGTALKFQQWSKLLHLQDNGFLQRTDGPIHLRVANKLKPATHNNFQTQATSENRTRFNLQKSFNIKGWPKRFTDPNDSKESNTKSWGGDQNLKNLGRIVAAATIGDYLVNLDLWATTSWVTDYLTTNEPIEFFQLSGFLKWKKYVPLIIDDRPIWESGNQDFQVKITLLRPEDEFHYYLCLPVADSLDTTGL